MEILIALFFPVIIFVMIFWDWIILLIVTIIATVVGKKNWGAKGGWIGFGLTFGLYVVYILSAYSYYFLQVYPYCKKYENIEIYTTPEEWRELMKYNHEKITIQAPKKIIFQGREFYLDRNQPSNEQFKEYYGYKKYYEDGEISVYTHMYIDIYLKKILYLATNVNKYYIPNINTNISKGSYPSKLDAILGGLGSDPCVKKNLYDYLQNYNF